VTRTPPQPPAEAPPGAAPGAAPEAPPPKRRVSWRKTYRAIPTRYPPISLFERVADPEDWDALIEIESLTNARIRDAIGEIALVPPRERVSGPGASWVMASFTHVGPPSRFSDGTYGVYYTARTLACAVAETAYHWARFYAATAEAACDLDMRLLVARIDAALHDIRGGPREPRWRALHDPDDYAASQRFAAALREQGSAGLAYDSVRLPGDQCVAAFTPRVVKQMPRGDRFLLYHWDGERIARYYDYAEDGWVVL
jgi:hypothetical protein